MAAMGIATRPCSLSPIAMACGPPRCATCNGSRSSCPRAACTFTASRTAFPAYIRSAVMRCGLSASYDASTRQTPTYSFPSAAGQSAPLGFTASSSASGRPPRCHSRSTRTCFAMPVGSSSPTMATTRGPCSITSGTRTFSTPSDTPKGPPTDSRLFGETDNAVAPHGRSSRSKKTTLHIVEITRPLAVASCAECAPAARSQCRPRSSGSACAWTIAFRGNGLREPGARQLRRAFNDFRRLTGSRREHGLDGLDGLLDLLVAHRLDAPAVLELHLARHQKRKNLEVRGRLVTSDLLDRLLAVLTEMQQQRLHELLIEQVTRAVPVAVRVAFAALSGRDMKQFLNFTLPPTGGFTTA